MNIQISNRFFATEIQNYCHPIRAWIREAFQNGGPDAGASKIDITLTDDCVITFADNGKGMDVDTLKNKFLTLGETGKEGQDTIGGYGRAKIILAFVHNSYKIISHNYICEGKGSTYQINENDSFYQGVKLIVDLVWKNKQEIINAIHYVFRLSNFRGAVTLNGENVDCGYNKGRLVKELSFGYIYHNKSSNIKNRIIYRVGGVWMFEGYTNLDSCITLEIHPSISREVLTSNRDSLQYQQREEIDQFINVLAVEKDKLFKKKSKQFVAKFGGGFIKFVKKAVRKVLPTQNSDIPNIFEDYGIVNSPVAAFQSTPRYNFAGFSETETTEDNSEEIIDPILSTMIVVNESEDPKIANVAKTYFPSYWQKYNSGGDKLKLLRMWNEAIVIALEKFTEKTGITDIDYAVGFVFDTGAEKTLAKYKPEDGGAYFLMNPINDDGKMAMSLNNKGDIFKLLGRASHEVTHRLHNHHDVDFSYLRDDLFEAILEDSNEAIRRVKEAKDK